MYLLMPVYIAIMHYFFIMMNYWYYLLTYSLSLAIIITASYSFLDRVDFPTQHSYMKRQWNQFIIWILINIKTVYFPAILLVVIA